MRHTCDGFTTSQRRESVRSALRCTCRMRTTPRQNTRVCGMSPRPQKTPDPRTNRESGAPPPWVGPSETGVTGAVWATSGLAARASLMRRAKPAPLIGLASGAPVAVAVCGCHVVRGAHRAAARSLRDVGSRLTHPVRVISKHANPPIAIRAQQSTERASLMVMVNGQPTVPSAHVPPAASTRPPLHSRFEEGAHSAWRKGHGNARNRCTPRRCIRLLACLICYGHRQDPRLSKRILHPTAECRRRSTRRSGCRMLWHPLVTVDHQPAGP